MTHPLADRCPECGAERNLPPVEPDQVTEVSLSGLRADYKCPACGHEWFTGWDERASGAAIRQEHVA